MRVVGDGGSTHPVVLVCHPDWRGIRAATAALGPPVIECADLESGAPEVLAAVDRLGAALVVISGFPPGAAAFAELASAGGLTVRVVMHSSMAQHGAEPGEAAIIATIGRLLGEGAVDRLGFTKSGQAEAITALGIPSVFVPARIGHLDPVSPIDLGPGRHVGVFAEATWRKNVTTEVGAAALLGATAHATHLPPVDYLSGSVVEHGLVPRDEFLSLLASVDLNLAVSLYECFPLLPQESVWMGVPCLVSRTSALFTGDDVLERYLLVAEHDNPASIAAASERLLRDVEEEGLVARAAGWMRSWNERTEPQRAAFLDL